MARPKITWAHLKQPDFIIVAHGPFPRLLEWLMVSDPLSNSLDHLLGLAHSYTLITTFVCSFLGRVVVFVIALVKKANTLCYLLCAFSSPISLAFVIVFVVAITTWAFFKQQAFGILSWFCCFRSWHY